MTSLPPRGTVAAHSHTHRDLVHLIDDRRGALGRRRALQVLGGIGLTGLLAACSSSSTSSSGTTSTAAADPTTSAAGDTSSTAGNATTESTAAEASATEVEASAGESIPDETAGPFPADGSNGPNVLTDGAVVRSDITASIGDLSGTAEGVPTTVQLTVVDAASGSPLPAHALYLWQCSATGRYSIYEIEDQNYLRGVQVTDDAGRLTFTTVFPGCYAGRWPHWHFEVYDSLDAADAGANAIKTSQIALPQADCETAYADDRYGDSAANLSQLSLDTDGIFRDGWTDQLATVAGSNTDGYIVSLLVRI